MECDKLCGNLALMLDCSNLDGGLFLRCRIRHTFSISKNATLTSQCVFPFFNCLWLKL